jgi:hypothetical protein
MSDDRRLADVRAGTAEEMKCGGSGYLLGAKLVLTCRHVVLDEEEGRPWSHVQVRLGHPVNGPQRHVRARVVWVHPDQARDAALLRIDGEPYPAGDPLRWGWFAGTDPVVYTGWGYPLFANYESGPGVEQLGGTVAPLALGADGAYVLDQDSAPEPTKRAWPGVSGAAVFCGKELLTAMVTKDDSEFGNRRLHAVPAHALTADPEFARLVAADTGVAPVQEAVELADSMESAGNQVLARTPGSLLAATVEAVSFTGRAVEMIDLTGWREGAQPFSVMLVTGEGGQGKTRLGREFCAYARRAGWAAGFLANGLPAAGRNESNHLQAAAELAQRIRNPSRPVLLVADYAETRPKVVAELVEGLHGERSGRPVRLLLLSRTAGDWWTGLTDALGPDLTARINLAPLTNTDDARRAAYVAAVAELAWHLALLPDLAIGREPGQPWSALAERLARQPRGLGDPRLGNALTLQMTALADLLASATGEELARLGTSVEQRLVRHEHDYLRRAAAKHGLFTMGVLSDRIDDDVRAAAAWKALERALAGIILLGPCDGSQAQSIGALASSARAEDVAIWLAELYPPPEPRFRVGTVQPDRLAELLLGPVLTQQTGALGQIAMLATEIGDAYAVLFALMRTAAHPEYSGIGEQIPDLLAGHPDPFAIAAPVLAAMLPQPLPLMNGLLRLGQETPQAFKDTAYQAVDQLPHHSVSTTYFSAALTAVLSTLLRTLAGSNPDAYLPDLASALNNLGTRLASAGQRQAAVAPAEEAAGIYRQLAETDPGTYLPSLATALNNLGTQRADAGQHQAALAPTEEAITVLRQLAEADPDAHLPSLASALSNLGNQLGSAGQRQAALGPAGEAITVLRQLAETDPDAHLPSLATALNNLGTQRADAGQHQAALAPTEEAITVLRQLAEADPDAHLPSLASALNNLGNQLRSAGQRQAALAPTEEAITVLRQLAEAVPDAHLPSLASALSNLGTQLAWAGQQQAALAPAREAVVILRQLAEADPDAHLRDFGASLNNLGNRLAEVGQQRAALDYTQEAVTVRRQLARADPDAHLPDLASSLSNLGVGLAEAGQHQAALAAAREAADAYRQLAEADPDAYLPDLATALENLGAHYGNAGQPEAALDATQEAVALHRRLAEAIPGAHLPGLARSLSNLSTQLALAGQQQAALDPAEEEVAILRRLAEADPNAHFPDLAAALKNLGAGLAEAGYRKAARAPTQQALLMYRMLARVDPDRHLPHLGACLNNLSVLYSAAGSPDVAGQMWESTIKDLPEHASRMTLSVAYAKYLLAQQDSYPGAELLAQVLAAPEVPGPVEAAARRLMRTHWRRHAQEAKRAWQSVSPTSLPDWVRLSDEHLATVMEWINAPTGTDSRAYFHAHASELAGPEIGTVLDEFALSAPADVIDRHRALLVAQREHRLDDAYHPLLLADALHEWMATPDPETSRAYLGEHPDLLGEDAFRILQSLNDHSGSEIITHQAMLILAREPTGVDRAYECLTDRQAVKILASEAIAARDAPRLEACAVIEVYVHDRALAGTVYKALAMLMTAPSELLPVGFASRLRDLATQADAAERDAVKTECNAALTSLGLNTAAAEEVRQALTIARE